MALLIQISYQVLAQGSTSADLLEPAQPPLCLNRGDLAFFVPSCWFGCFSFTLVRFSAITTFMKNTVHTVLATKELAYFATPSFDLL